MCDVLNATQVFKTTEDEREKIAKDFDKDNTVSHSKSKDIERKQKFIDTFFEINGRVPNEEEIDKLFSSDNTNLILDFEEESNFTNV